MKKKKLQSIIVWLVLFLFTLIVCSAFLQPHYTQDTYKIIRDGYEFYSYDKFLKESRPITAMLTIFAGKVNLSIEAYMIISFIISIAILTFSVVIMYKMFEQRAKDLTSIKKIALILISYITIFSYLTIEHIFFLEACIMALGILTSVVASKIIVDGEKQKWLKASLMLFIGVFCYQGSISILPIILLTYYAIVEPVKFKEYIKIIIKSAILYGGMMLASLIYVKVFFGGSRIQMGTNLIEFKELVNALNQLVINSLGILPSFVHIGITIFTIIFILCFNKDKMKENLYIAIKYILIIIAAISICIMPVIVGSGLSLEPRMCMSYGSTIGVSLLFIYWITTNYKEENKILNWILYSIILSIFILTVILYNTITIQHIKVNRFDKEICNRINNIISEYEEKTEIKVEKIAAINEINQDIFLEGFIPTRAYNQRATSSWASRETIIYYTKRPMTFAPITIEQYVKYFKIRDWKEFSEEQIVIKGDTLYFCAY